MQPCGSQTISGSAWVGSGVGAISCVAAVDVAGAGGADGVEFDMAGACVVVAQARLARNKTPNRQQKLLIRFFIYTSKG